MDLKDGKNEQDYYKLENPENIEEINGSRRKRNFIILIGFLFILICIIMIVVVYLYKGKKEEDEKKNEEIVIIHVNDVHCGINDTIGYDGFALYYDELKKNYSNVIKVDVGDHIQGGTLGAISDGRAIIDIMNKIGFDVTILGNHEFDFGIEQLKRLGKNITGGYICANFRYRKNKTTLFNPYKIIEKAGKKIAFIGVLTPVTLAKTYLSTIKDEDGGLLYDFCAGTEGQELPETIQGYINEVKKYKKVDYVILLTHIGMTSEEYTSEGLLSKLENVDAVFDGHTHKIYNTTIPDKNKKEIHITQTGTKLNRIGKLIIKPDGKIISENIEVIPEPKDKTGVKNLNRKSQNRWVKEEIFNFVEKIWEEYQYELNIIIGNCDFDLIVVDDNNNNYCRLKECTLGNLASDAIKDAGKGEITILNGGTVRNNIKKGVLTRGRLIDIFPWFNNIVLKEITGNTIRDALEFGVSFYPKSAGSFPQVSGITFDIDPSIDSTVVVDSSGMFVNVTGERRVSNIKINGEELDLERIYKISLLEFIANGGDGYSMFSKYEVTNESLMTDTDAISNYIENNLNGEIPEKYKNHQGRINIKNEKATQNSKETDTETEKTTNTTYQSFLYFPYGKNGYKILGSGFIVIVLLYIVALTILIALYFACKNKNLQINIEQYEPSIVKRNILKNIK